MNQLIQRLKPEFIYLGQLLLFGWHLLLHLQLLVEERLLLLEDDVWLVCSISWLGLMSQWWVILLSKSKDRSCTVSIGAERTRLLLIYIWLIIKLISVDVSFVVVLSFIVARVCLLEWHVILLDEFELLAVDCLSAYSLVWVAASLGLGHHDLWVLRLWQESLMLRYTHFSFTFWIQSSVLTSWMWICTGLTNHEELLVDELLLILIGSLIIFNVILSRWHFFFLLNKF